MNPGHGAQFIPTPADCQALPCSSSRELTAGDDSFEEPYPLSGLETRGKKVAESCSQLESQARKIMYMVPTDDSLVLHEHTFGKGSMHGTNHSTRGKTLLPSNATKKTSRKVEKSTKIWNMTRKKWRERASGMRLKPSALLSYVIFVRETHFPGIEITPPSFLRYTVLQHRGIMFTSSHHKNSTALW